jgi:hypothetical protein
MKYKFRVMAVSEQNLQSKYSKIASFYAASLPATITFPVIPFTEIAKSTLELTWNQPTLAVTDLPINSYKIYWNEGIRASGTFTLLAEVKSFD